MLTFEEIEKKFAVSPVRLQGRDVTGVLKVARDETAIDFISTKFLHFEGGENGWFDLELTGPDGRGILVHNAIRNGSGSHMAEGMSTAFHASVRPNVLVFDSAGLDAQYRVAAVVVRLEKLEHFFDYQYVELLSCHELPEATKSALKAMRYGEEDDETEKDFFAPAHAYLIHEMNEILQFRLDDRLYKVWTGGRSGSMLSWHKASFEAFPFLGIYFDAPVSIDEALNRVWEWRGFFTQMAMCPLCPESIYFQRGHEVLSPMGSVYLPNSKRSGDYPPILHEPHPAYLPLNRWNEREALSAAMQKWLSCYDGRRAFRGRLGRVITEMNWRSDQTDLLELCAGIDSLAGLDTKTAFPKGTIRQMAESAQQAAKEREVTIGLDRLCGVLGGLQRRSLAEKMKELCKRAGLATSSEIDILVKTAREIRDDIAHRGTASEQRNPLIAPVVEALAALCVAFHLHSAGVPPKRAANDFDSPWKRRFSHAMRELKQMLHRG